jgi:hypothetical protein
MSPVATSQPSPLIVSFSRAVTRVRELALVLNARPRTDDEEREIEWERGKIAGLNGYRLRGVESPSFLCGHARGCVDARGGR